MITKEQQRLNEWLMAEELKGKIESLIADYADKIPGDLLLACLEVTKLKYSGFVSHMVWDRINKEDK